MSRHSPCPLFAVLILALVASPAARGQQASTGDDPFDKARARALREGRQGQREALGQALRNAARTAYSMRLPHVRQGTETPDVLLYDMARLVAADYALAMTPAERVAALGQYCSVLREAERLTLDRVLAGIKQFSSADYWAARSERLLAELRLVKELGGVSKPLPGSLHASLNDPDPLESWEPRAGFVASRAGPRQLAQAARDSCANEYAVRIGRIRGGTETPDVLLLVGFRSLAAVQAVSDDPAEYLAAVEAAWLLCRDVEDLTQKRVEAGARMFSPADYFDARDRCLETGVLLVEARRGAATPRPLQGGLQHPFAAVHDDPLDTKDVARAKSEATRAGAEGLNGQRRETLLTASRVRVERVRAGTDSAEMTSADSRRLLDAELALAGENKAVRLAALERNLARAAEIEALVQERVELGVKTFTPADVWEARYDRILAELSIAEARAAKD
jgi:hypothetical protein